ncbi:MAG: hypothetical protein WBA22_11615 [Candidatus Methanofastidiosia archaeon]
MKTVSISGAAGHTGSRVYYKWEFYDIVPVDDFFKEAVYEICGVEAAKEILDPPLG